MPIDDAVAAAALRQLKTAWNGRFPSWEDYKSADRAGTVSANKAVALRLVRTAPVPMPMRIVYGVLLPWAALLVVPSLVLACWLLGLNWLWLIVGVIGSAVLFNIAREGQCECLKLGAARDPGFYMVAASAGGLLFTPPTQ